MEERHTKGRNRREEDKSKEDSLRKEKKNFLKSRKELVLLPKNSTSVHQCQIETWRQSSGGVERSSFITLPGKEGNRGLMLSRLCPLSWEAGRGLIVSGWKIGL